MPRKKLPLALDGDPETPVFLQIARAITADVRRGRLTGGDELPSSRSLAAELGVHRNTVLAAYRELESEGWIVTRRGRGTYVSSALPDERPRRLVKDAPRFPDAPGFPLPPLAAPTDRPAPVDVPYALLGGYADLRHVPTQALARAYRRALDPRRTRRMLGYVDPRGEDSLRSALAAMLARTRGIPVPPEALTVVRGSQEGLYLAARTLLAPGDVVACEALGYAPAWQALRLAGAELAPLPVDADGLRVDALAELVARRPVRAVYLTPHHQHPTTATLKADRRLALLELARRHRLAILEDDYDHEFHYEGRPVLPLAATDAHGSVVYVGTLSKVLAPGLRIGYVVAPRAIVDRIATYRTYVDRQGDPAVERAVATLLEDGEVERHAHRMRRLYRGRRDALAHALERTCGERLEFALPPGGMALWAKVQGVDPDAWLSRCEARGVTFQTGKRFDFGGRARPFVRLGFACCDETELAEAVARMASVWPRGGSAQRVRR